MEQPSYIGSVPAEIWAEVFQHAQGSPVSERTYDQTKITQNDVPLSVSQVCTRFRQVAITAPRLWTSIIVDMSSPNSSANLFSTQLWLARSKTAPLSVFVYRMDGEDMAANPEKQECFVALLCHLSRWECGFLEWTTADSNFWLLLESVADAPLLKSLLLKPKVDETIMEKGVLPSRLWANSPRLQRLVVMLRVMVEEDNEYYPPEEDQYSSWANSYAIPYNQLTHLHLSACPHEIISRKEVLNIFQLAQNLVCCFIQWIGGPEPESEEGSVPSPVLVTRLKHLYVEPAESSDTHYYDIPTSRLLNYITAPSLVSLTLARQRDWDFEPYKNFIQRSACALEELNLIDVSVKVDNIHECIKLISPSLRKLHVDRLSTVSEDVFIQSLTTWDPATREYTLCPRLEQISLAPYPVAFYGHPPAFSLITKVLASRMQPPEGGSKTFKVLYIPARWANQVAPELRKLREDPTSLTIAFNDDMLEKDALWERLSYQ